MPTSPEELRTNRAPHPFATWVRDALEVAYDHVRHLLHHTAARRKCLYDVKAVNRKFPVGSWVLRYYPPAAQKKLGSPWVGPQQVVRQATGHTVGIQKGPATPFVFIHVDDLKLCPAPWDVSWTPGPSTAKSLCASTVAFRPGSHVSDSESTPSVIVGPSLPGMSVSFNRASCVLLLCCDPWTQIICYQHSEVGQTPHRIPDKSFPYS